MTANPACKSLLLPLALLLLLARVVSEVDECRFDDDIKVPTVSLSNGVEMPRLLLGTAFRNGWKQFYPEQTYRSAQMALESGMRGFDTAVIYRSHRPLGRVLGTWLASGDLERKHIYLQTKIFHGPNPLATDKTCMPNSDDFTPDQVIKMLSEHFEDALVDVGVGHFDVVLLHWPGTANSKDPGNRARRLAAWRVLEKYYEKEWVRAIGVSNFHEGHLEQLMEDGAKIRPMVNQIEASVYLQWDNIIRYCKDHQIAIQAYSPMGFGRQDMANDPVLLRVAEKHGKDYGQVIMRYLLQKGFDSVVVMSGDREHIHNNQDIFSFELDDDEMKTLSELARSDGTWGMPSPYDID